MKDDTKTFSVEVSKTTVHSGEYQVKALNADEAVEKVKKAIMDGKLNASEINWKDPEYYYDFNVTGSVSECFII